jgi:cellulose synthase/poly-beta-1,6-N-acetylglucosamine synthase-like glycosyltransferase
MSIASEIRSVDVDLQSLIDPRFTIIVPAFKEGNQDRADGFEAFLYDLKDTSASYNPNLNHELIVFDDGSKANDPKDMTISIAS